MTMLLKGGIFGSTMSIHRRLLLAPCAVSSSNSDEPAIAGATSDRRHLDTARPDEKSREEEERRYVETRSKSQPQSFFTAVAAAALVASSALSSPLSFLFFPPPAQASAGGDALITFNKRADAAADAVAGALLGALPKMRTSNSSSSSLSSSFSPAEAAAAAAADSEAAAAASAAAAAALLKEVRDVVALNYLDTRSDSGKGASSSSSLTSLTSSSSGDDSNGNFDLAAWDAAVEAELTGGESSRSSGGLFSSFGAKKAEKKNNNRLKDVPAARRAARRLLAFSLPDPYSRFLSPEEFAAMARYDVTGVGLNLGSADEYERKVGERPPGAAAAGEEESSSSRKGKGNDSPGVWVIGVIRGSPADAAGVRQGDRVAAVDGKDVDLSKESAFDVASRIQGAGVAAAKEERGGGEATATATATQKTKSTKSLFSSFPLLSSSSSSSSSSVRKLSLDVLRRSDGSRSRVEMRAPVAPAAVSPVSFKLVVEEGKKIDKKDSKVGVIKLDSFNARARTDAAAAVSELLSKGANSFVLDLRGNRGGLVSEGAEVAALFLEKGSTVATTLGRAPLLDNDSSSAETPKMTKTTTRKLPTTAEPLVPPEKARLTVLIDERTASAGEIVAGALRDNCRAPLVAVSGPSTAAAKRTYGKGLIQSVYELEDGSGLVLTVGKYFTPKGTDLDREGLSPDLEVIGGGSGVPSRAEAEAVLDACLRERG